MLPAHEYHETLPGHLGYQASPLYRMVQIGVLLWGAPLDTGNIKILSEVEIFV